MKSRIQFILCYCFSIRLCALLLLGEGLQNSPTIAPDLFNDFVIDHWELEDGLPQNTVNSIVQTRDGYLWLATFNGLVRFDGVKFDVFDKSNTPEMTDNYILKLASTRGGGLWIMPQFGKLLYWFNGEFMEIDTHNDRIDALSEGPDGGIWLANHDGAIHQMVEGQYELKGDAQGFTSSYLRQLIHDYQGNLWVVEKPGVARFDIDSGYHPIIEGTSNNLVNAVRAAPRADGGVWVATESSLRDFENGKFGSHTFSYPVAYSRIFCLLEDRAGDVWVGTRGVGIWRFNKQGDLRIYDTKTGLSNNSIRCLYEDLEGNMWVGTDGGGLNRLKSRAFSVYDGRHGMGNGIVRSVTGTGDGTLWCGLTGDGLVQVKEGRIERVALPDIVDEDSYVWSVLYDTNDRLWFCNYGSGVCSIKNSVVKDYTLEGGLNRRHVQAIYEDSENRIWMSGGFGITRIDEGEIKDFTMEDGLPDEGIRSITQDSNGLMYFGSNGAGLIQFDAGKFRIFSEADGLPDKQVWSLYADQEQNLWVGTMGAGLCRFRNGEFFHFDPVNSLPTKVVTGMMEDDLGFLWIATGDGIFRVSKKQLNDLADGERDSLSFRRYDKADGLGGSECSGGLQPVVHKTPDGRIHFATVKGVASVDPRDLRQNQVSPPMVIETFIADGIVLPISADSTVAVSSASGNFEFHYTGLSFREPEKVQFRYRLEGLDTDWTDAGNRRIAYFNRIPPGQYRFQVIGANSDGIWNEEGASVALFVHPFFWQTNWFKGFSLMGSAALLAYLGRLIAMIRVRRRMQLLEKENAIQTERTRIARNIHDELGACLTQISYQSRLAEADKHDTVELFRHIDKMNVTASESIRALDASVWAINPDKDTLEELADYMISYADSYFSSSEVVCRWEFPTSIPQAMISAEVRHGIFLCYKEILTNILRHARADEVRITIAIADGEFRVVVQDNGVGFDWEHALDAGERNGLRFVNDRARELRGSVEWNGNAPSGTIASLRFQIESLS